MFGAGDPGDARVSLRQLLGPLLASPTFWLVCLMNTGLTAIRETFNAWTPLYLEKGVGLDGRRRRAAVVRVPAVRGGGVARRRVGRRTGSAGGSAG